MVNLSVMCRLCNQEKKIWREIVGSPANIQVQHQRSQKIKAHCAIIGQDKEDQDSDHTLSLPPEDLRHNRKTSITSSCNKRFNRVCLQTMKAQSVAMMLTMMIMITSSRCRRPTDVSLFIRLIRLKTCFTHEMTSPVYTPT